jgi:hypothetical protein
MDCQNTKLLSCPLCDFSDYDGFFLSQHVELCHPEDDLSPSIMCQDVEKFTGLEEGEDDPSAICSPPSDQQGTTYFDCPHGCGEVVTASDLPAHMDFHVAETLAIEETDAVGITPHSEAVHSSSLAIAGYHSNIEEPSTLQDCKSDREKEFASQRGQRIKASETNQAVATITGGRKRLGVLRKLVSYSIVLCLFVLTIA